MAKISKRLACCFILGFILLQSMHGQATSSNFKIVYNEASQEVILLKGQDSLAAIMMNSIEAKYNYQKTKKNKTIYYPLASYSKPTLLAKVPIGLFQLASLDVVGTLHGDTAARFSCLFSHWYDDIKMELSTSFVSTNEFSFSVRLFSGAKLNLNPAEFPNVTYIKTKKNYIRITVRGEQTYFIFKFKSPQPTPY